MVYNIFDQAPEDELFPVCRDLNVAVIARVPFDEGTLTGKLTVDSSWPEGDFRNAYFTPDNLRESVRRAGGAPPAGAAGHDDGGDGATVDSVEPRRERGDSRHAQGAARGGKPGRK